MAVTQYYVDPGGGNDTTGDGTITTPWKTVQKALDTITRNSTDGDRINIKAGTAATLTAALSLSSYGTPGNASPLIFQGYTSAAGDGGIGEINGAGTYSIYDSSGNSNKSNIVFADLKIGNSGSASVARLYTNSIIFNCEVYGSSNATGIYLSGASNAIMYSYIHSLTGPYNVRIDGTGICAYCYIKSESSLTVLYAVPSFAVVINNIIEISTDTSSRGIYLDGGKNICMNNTVFSRSANTLTGITSTFVNINNIVEGYSGSGGKGFESGTFSIFGNQAIYNCATTIGYDANKYIYPVGTNTTLAASAFANATGGNFAIAANMAGVTESSFPTTWKEITGTVNKAEKGAVQSGAGSGGGGPVIGSRIIRGLGAI